jgi:hypothetical protein
MESLRDGREVELPWPMAEEHLVICPATRHMHPPGPLRSIWCAAHHGHQVDALGGMVGALRGTGRVAVRRVDAERL